MNEKLELYHECKMSSICHVKLYGSFDHIKNPNGVTIEFLDGPLLDKRFKIEEVEEDNHVDQLP